MTGQRRTPLVAIACVLVLILGACGGSGGGDESEGSDPVGGDGLGATLTNSDGVEVVYRGAVVQRSDSDDPANPVRTRVYVGFDLSLPDGESGFFSDGFINSATRIDLLELDVSSLEPCDLPPMIPRYRGGQGHRSNEVLIDGPVTLTFVRCFGILGAERSDAELTIDARLDSSDDVERGEWAAVGAPMDDDVLADVEASIAWLHDNLDPTDRYVDGRSEWEPNVFGQEIFDEHYVDGLEAFDTVGEGPAGTDLDFDDAPSAGETIPPPPPPPEIEPDPEIEDEDEDTRPAPEPDPVDTGTAIDYSTATGLADSRSAEIDVVRMIVDGMQRGSSGFVDCDVADPSDPCIDIRAHLHANGKDHRLVVSIRLESATERYTRDLWLQIENPDPATSVWTVTQDWWVEDDDSPPWAI